MASEKKKEDEKPPKPKEKEVKKSSSEEKRPANTPTHIPSQLYDTVVNKYIPPTIIWLGVGLAFFVLIILKLICVQWK